MKLLIVAATEAEIAPFSALAGAKADILITGVGMMATAYALTKKLQETKYDLVIQAGVGGSFDKDIPPGSVVFVTSDRYADLGAEDHDKYLDITEMGLLDKNTKPFMNGVLYTPLFPVHDKIKLRRVAGLSVNTVSGNEKTISRRREYGCAVESMEGVAFHYVCMQEEVPFAQIRAISNYVTPRDKSQWEMKEAIENLNASLAWIISELG